MASRTVAQLFLSLALSLTTQAQSLELSKTVQEFIRVRAPKVVLTYVRVNLAPAAPPEKTETW